MSHELNWDAVKDLKRKEKKGHFLRERGLKGLLILLKPKHQL